MVQLQSALEHYRRQRRIATLGLIGARREQQRGNLKRALALVTFAQLQAAQDAVTASQDMLDEQGVRAPAIAAVDAAALAGVASDGRDLLGLLQAVSRPEAPAGSFDRAVLTQISDAGRAGGAVSIAARPKVTGYVRMLVPPSCSRCAILAGKEYRWNQGFQRHPHCFPAGVVVSGPASEKATRRWYEGELVVLTTASGQELPVTGNHPILTRRGWVPANLIEEGDEVVRSTRPEGATPLVVPDHDQVPTRIEDVWRSLGMLGLEAVESSPEDFHGDGQDGQVDVAGADGALVGDVLATFVQQAGQEGLAVALRSAAGLVGESSSEQLDVRDLALTGSLVGRSSLGSALVFGHLRGSHESRFARATHMHSSGLKAAPDGLSRDAVLARQGVFAGAGLVLPHDRAIRNGDSVSRWDAPAGPFMSQSVVGYASRGSDLLNRLSGQVELDSVVHRVRRDFAGHVYSLTSSEGWHVANSLIVSNCDCRHIPTTERTAGHLTTDPRAYFDSLDAAQQERIFTKAGAQSIRDGADMAQVVNARRGMTTAQVGSERVLATRAGATRGRVRLMPETIMQIAGSDRTEAIRLLRLHGYLRD
ncbi:hypothetical protein [Dermacoccus sp. GAS27A]|uniref:hypothetical protein n=1 Tax=Dermacoccus sp. GAS27A TaxID=3156270 RepID=UPI003832DED9